MAENSCEEMHQSRCLGACGIVDVGGEPIFKITTHWQSPHDTVDVLIPTGMMRGIS